MRKPPKDRILKPSQHKWKDVLAISEFEIEIGVVSQEFKHVAPHHRLSQIFHKFERA